MTNFLYQLLKGTFYPKYIPEFSNRYYIFGWKFISFGGAPEQGKDIIFLCLKTKKNIFTSNIELQANCLIEEAYIKYAQEHGFKFIQKLDNSLEFKK